MVQALICNVHALYLLFNTARSPPPRSFFFPKPSRRGNCSTTMDRFFTFCAVWVWVVALITSTLAIYAEEEILGYQGIISIFPLQQNEGTSDLFPMPPCGDGSFQLEEATIDEMQQAMVRGELTSVQLTLCYMQRVYQLQSYTKLVSPVGSLSLDFKKPLNII